MQAVKDRIAPGMWCVVRGILTDRRPQPAVMQVTHVRCRGVRAVFADGTKRWRALHFEDIFCVLPDREGAEAALADIMDAWKRHEGPIRDVFEARDADVRVASLRAMGALPE